MGCLLSTPGEASPLRRAASIGEVAVFVPGFRIPESVDLSQPLGDCLSRGLLDRLSSLRTRMVTMAAQEARRFTKPRRITTTRHGSALSELLRALEDYLPVLLGLVKDGCQLRDKVPFVWINQEDDAEETAMTNAWYEVLSVLHLMAMLSLLQANRLLLPKISSEGYQLKISEENRRKSIDILLKAAGYLDCAIRHVLPQITPEHRKDLPLDLEEGVLRALCLQALGQCVDIQLGMAIDSPKATLAVKRRLACEMVNYWHQAQNNMAKLPSTDGWAKKHQLFIKWKYAEAKAAAYYYHGLILDEGNTEKSHGVAIAALQASEEYLKESKKACETFNSTPPTSRNPPLWGSMKYLSEKIPKDASSKIRINQDLYSEERTFKTAPTLPDFALALKGIGNLLVPNDNYCKFEDWIMPILDQMLLEQTTENVVWTPSKVIARLGKEINDESSYLYWAYKNNVSVYCPALTDGSLGDMLYCHSVRNPGLLIDIVQDIRAMNGEAVHVGLRKTGVIILGGGLPKHHICNANMFRNGADYAVYVNTAQEFDGSDSGAEPDEAISWGKIKGSAKTIKVHCDATIAFPLLVAATFARKFQERNNKLA